MEETKELNIKNQTYYFLDDMTDIKFFYSDLLKIDKKPYKDVDITILITSELKSLVMVKTFIA